MVRLGLAVGIRLHFQTGMLSHDQQSMLSNININIFIHKYHIYTCYKISETLQNVKIYFPLHLYTYIWVGGYEETISVRLWYPIKNEI